MVGSYVRLEEIQFSQKGQNRNFDQKSESEDMIGIIEFDLMIIGQ